MSGLAATPVISPPGASEERPRRDRNPACKVVYFATGPVSDAAADIKRFGLAEHNLRVVVVAANARSLAQAAGLAPEQIHSFTGNPIALWVRLLGFLGLCARARIVCLSAPGGGSATSKQRILKAVALALRARVEFSSGAGPTVSMTLYRLVQVAFAKIFGARGPICFVAHDSAQTTTEVLHSLRRRFPHVPVHVVLPPNSSREVVTEGVSALSLPSSRVQAYLLLLRRCLGRNRFCRIVFCWTETPPARPVWPAWFLPLWRVEIYNDNQDILIGRNPIALIEHWIWLSRRRRERRRARLPVGVIGSASGYYLEKIVRVVRERYPEVPLHAIFSGPRNEVTRNLFDSVEVIEPSWWRAVALAFRLALRRNAYQCWIVPCTDEPYYFLKAMAFLWPLSRRQIYNELADGFALASPRSAWRHFRWRLRDHLSYQIWSGAAGNNPLTRVMHVMLYAARLLGAIPLLWSARVGAAYRKTIATKVAPAQYKHHVDVIVFGSPSQAAEIRARYGGHGFVRVREARRAGRPMAEAYSAAQNSRAEFICLLDAGCELHPHDWLEQLLAAFDDRVAQVGPQFRSPGRPPVLRGALFGPRNSLFWNTDHATRWYVSPEWLRIDALPWPCLVIRRSVLLQAGKNLFNEQPSTLFTGATMWVDEEFCRRVAAQGWISLCNGSVSATHPMAVVASEALSEES